MTPEQEIARKKQLVSAARALLSLQVGIGAGCTRIRKVLHWLSLQDDEKFQVFKEFCRATAGFPIGNERLLWETSALLQHDARLAKIEDEFRPRLLKACIDIIAEFG